MDFQSIALPTELSGQVHFRASCGGRIWTYDLRVMSPTSFQTAPPRVIIYFLLLYSIFSRISIVFNGRRWIRTTEASCSRFTVCPLWPLGNPPIFILNCSLFSEADDRTRTDNLLITNQLLCQLSHIGICLLANGWRWIRTTESVANRFTVCPLWPLGNPSIMGPIGLEPMTPCL